MNIERARAADDRPVIAEVRPRSGTRLLAELGCADAYLPRAYVEALAAARAGTAAAAAQRGAVFAAIVREIPDADVITPYGYGGPGRRRASGDDVRRVVPRARRRLDLRPLPPAASRTSARPPGASTRAPRRHGRLAARRRRRPARAHAPQPPQRRAEGAEGRRVSRGDRRARRTRARSRALYERTMERQEAADFYFFPDAYWESSLRSATGSSSSTRSAGDESPRCSASRRRPGSTTTSAPPSDRGRELGANALLFSRGRALGAGARLRALPPRRRRRRRARLAVRVQAALRPRGRARDRRSARPSTTRRPTATRRATRDSTASSPPIALRSRRDPEGDLLGEPRRARVDARRLPGRRGGARAPAQRARWRGRHQPTVTLIVPAHDEEDVIGAPRREPARARLPGRAARDRGRLRRLDRRHRRDRRRLRRTTRACACSPASAAGSSPSMNRAVRESESEIARLRATPTRPGRPTRCASSCATSPIPRSRTSAARCASSGRTARTGRASTGATRCGCAGASRRSARSPAATARSTRCAARTTSSGRSATTSASRT